MHWLHDLDVGLLRFINETLSNSFFDWLMPFASGNRLFFPVVFLAGALLLWKGGVRGRLCILMLALIIWPGDSLVCNTIKHAVGRPRPFNALPDLRQPASKNRFDMASADMSRNDEDPARPSKKVSYTSMPSSHAANWFAATMILFVFYRRSWRVMLPLACLVAFSRLYNGVHYPSDVLAGMILGAGYAVAGLWAVNALWQWAGRRWFPLWWERLPSLLNAEGGMKNAETEIRNPKPADQTIGPAAIANPQSSILNPQSSLDRHWLRLGYVLIAVVLLIKLAYLRSGLIGLTGDEAYQWVWSKHPALSYVSKPPLIAYVQFLGTHLWGDNEFGVRFFSPVIGAMLALLVLRFFAREVSARAGFFLLLVILTTPLAAIGSILLTVDPLSVMFWTAAMMAGWRAAQPDGRTRHWLWTGLWMGLGLLSKYVGMVQWICWAVFLALWKPARAHLRRPGPYLALAINLVFALPVLIWNFQHGWSGVDHLVRHNARLDSAWQFSWGHVTDVLGFLGSQAAILNPVYFVAMLWAAVAFWRRKRNDMRLIYLFSMGAPLFLMYSIYSIRVRILPNWTAPCMLPLFCLMAIYWDDRWRQGLRFVKVWLIAGLAIGLPVIVLAHELDLVRRIVGRPLPPKVDPMTRVRAYREFAAVTGDARSKLLAEGKPVFLIGGHYQSASLINFYLPEARTNVIRNPLVYCLSSEGPANQYHYWPGYQDSRKGQNALFVRELSIPPMVKGWVFKWLSGETNLSEPEPERHRIPPLLLQEFESVTYLGQFNVFYDGRVFHIVQIFECRNLL